ncbi:hypothetical protein CC77DRAFT_1026979 [Alternaria alternata]|uniref:DNA ligase D 3'-phosphoesterase domain-containing protein n=1 Tax=Alternaria alternata TaxID=5599 RepID=A0A177E266_ALTAL|nr:hypothetical protein CC77DRAFT_1026979 [Alternaria alternata]OAG25818.1 hypothetical protein CC77DRAFT_1026979 [Alternaria alternata]
MCGVWVPSNHFVSMFAGRRCDVVDIWESLPSRQEGSLPTSNSRPSDPAGTPHLAHASIEAGKVKIDDHLTFFRSQLAGASRDTLPDIPRISICNFATLYQSNLQPHGHHFVVHQHNHPVAGVHYDLRLQFSKTSSISFALPKGLPGDPNSKSTGRLAIETRVHNYWNHLIECAGNKTGSLLIWDTGTYNNEETDNDSDSEATVRQRKYADEGGYENSRLVAAFKSGYIRLRLHGTRLPKDYAFTLRLTSSKMTKQVAVKRKSRKPSQACVEAQIPTTSDDEGGDANTSVQADAENQDLDTNTNVDDQTHVTNAYPGSSNDIGSIHQRHWFLQLDRQNSGFRLETSGNERGTWTGGFKPFLVRGRDHERSVVTGRLAREVESDEGLEGFVGRGGWTGIEY